MVPSIVQTVTETVDAKSSPKHVNGKATLNDPLPKLLKEPLQSTGSLDTFPHDDLTPSTGTEFTSATQLSALLKAPNADQLIRDLAILSTFSPQTSLQIIIDRSQYLKDVWFYSAIRISILTSKSSLPPNWAN
jgi:hypothetical protein